MPERRWRHERSHGTDTQCGEHIHSTVTDRAATLAMNGHPVDKIELLVLGGTWASYPHAYQEEFCRDLFYAANTFWERTKRPRRSLEEEQAENEVARCKIIGLTLETRPDTIDAAELRRLRRYGCTRVQRLWCQPVAGRDGSPQAGVQDTDHVRSGREDLGRLEDDSPLLQLVW